MHVNFLEQGQTFFMLSKRQRKRPALALGAWHPGLGISQPTIKTFRFTEGLTQGFPFTQRNNEWYFILSITSSRVIVIRGSPSFVAYSKQIGLNETTASGISLFHLLKQICQDPKTIDDTVTLSKLL